MSKEKVFWKKAINGNNGNEFFNNQKTIKSYSFELLF